MTSYTESKKKIEEIRNINETMFRMSVSHLMDVGYRHLTPENIECTCKEIMQEDDSKAFMTNEFKCDLVRMTGELAKVDHIHLLVYISREVYYDVFDKAMSYNRTIQLLKNYINSLDFNYVSLDELREIGFEDEELEWLGYGFLLDNEEE